MLCHFNHSKVVRVIHSSFTNWQIIISMEEVSENDTSSHSSQGPSDNRKSGGGKASPPSKSAKKYLHDKESDEYKKRRERNNIAVRKSRDKSRQKAQETMARVNELKSENAQLEQKVTILSKELSLLKDLFLAHAEELPDPSTTFGLYNSNLACSLVDGESSCSGGSNGSTQDDEENDQENNSPKVVVMKEQSAMVYTDHEYAAAARKGVKTEA